VDYGRAAMGRMALEDLYRRKGYYFAKITLDARQLEDSQRAVYTIVEGPRLRVKSIDFQFEGDRSYKSRKLRQQIKTSRALWIFSRGKLDAQQLNRDVDALRTFYRDQGYLDVQVARELAFNPNKTEATVTFIIDEGPRYRVGEIRIEGNTVFAPAELIGQLKMTSGRHFTALEQRRDVATLETAYGQIGYLDATVRPKMIFTAPDAPPPADVDAADDAPAAWLILVYNIVEGEQFRLGNVTIRGNTVTKDRVVRRQLVIFPGQWFSTAAKDKSEQRLRESQLFEAAEITPYGDEEDVRHALVTITDGRTTQLVVGGGYSTNSGVLGNISFTQRNFSWTQWPTSWYDLIHGRGFRGDGQSLQIQLEPGTEVFRSRIDWREPYLFDRPISLGAGAYIYERQRESYDETSAGGQVSLGRLFKNRWYGEVALEPETRNIENPDNDAPSEVQADLGSSFMVSVTGTLIRDRTDSRWQPSDGSRLTLQAQQYTGGYSFTRLGAGYTRYWTTYVDALDRKHILAARAQSDFIFGDAPVYLRLYGGGLGGVRGFQFRGISPRSKDADSDDPIGGDFKAYLGAEYSFPLAGESLRGVAFLDSGTVEDTVTIATWRASVGVGIRLLIPYMGPVPMSLDFAWPLKREDEDRPQTVSFTVGWVF
jgi:outer membrane protein insertion porin family